MIDGVEETVCARCGRSAAFTFPNLAGLQAAAALARAMEPAKLSGKDIRFLRRTLGWPAKQLARVLGVRDETVSRWETGREAIAVPSEKLLRVLVGLHLAEEGYWVGFHPRQIEEMEIVPAHHPPEMRLRPFRGAAPRAARRPRPWVRAEQAAA